LVQERRREEGRGAHDLNPEKIWDRVQKVKNKGAALNF